MAVEIATPVWQPLCGFFLVDKPTGPSSAQVVGKLKWRLRQLGAPKGLKVGHGGTLDPFATGLLPVGVGKATKALQVLLEGPKTYRFTLQFGAQTTTGDLTGQVVAESPLRPSRAEILAVLTQFVGEIVQTPPAFSALKVGGRRAYALARQGQAVELAPRKVWVQRLELLETTENASVFVAEVGKGTYIRTLGEDLARALGSRGHLTALRRTAHGPFDLRQAVTLEMLDKALESGDSSGHIRPLDAPLARMDPTGCDTN